MSNWTRLVHDPRHGHEHGLTYFCKKGHDWFVTFETLREIDSAWNNCPECEPPQTEAKPTDNL